eukprot:774828-Amphidinium_carterae.1
MATNPPHTWSIGPHATLSWGDLPVTPRASRTIGLQCSGGRLKQWRMSQPLLPDPPKLEHCWIASCGSSFSTGLGHSEVQHF